MGSRSIALADLRELAVRPRKQEPALWLALKRLADVESQARDTASKLVASSVPQVSVVSQEVPETVDGAELDFLD